MQKSSQKVETFFFPKSLYVFMLTTNSSKGNNLFFTYIKLGQYPLTVSNTWSTTKLFINDDIKEIVEFKKRYILIVHSS
jgi:hypothetical protein